MAPTACGLGHPHQPDAARPRRIRDLNDEINKLIREKGHWERRIVELGGPDYSKSAPKVADSKGQEVAEASGAGWGSGRAEGRGAEQTKTFAEGWGPSVAGRKVRAPADSKGQAAAGVVAGTSGVW